MFVDMCSEQCGKAIIPRRRRTLVLIAAFMTFPARNGQSRNGGGSILYITCPRMTITCQKMRGVLFHIILNVVAILGKNKLTSFENKRIGRSLFAN